MNIIYTFVVVITMQPIKRHEQLIKYSHEHHHTLALCLRILRQPAANHQADIEQYHGDLLAHFSSEEQEFAPYWVDINQPASLALQRHSITIASFIFFIIVENSPIH